MENKHIIVKEDSRDEFNKLKKEKGMTADGLIKFLVNNENRRLKEIQM